jgi:peptidoglycan/LPS O-acetylase OafA/YrhL
MDSELQTPRVGRDETLPDSDLVQALAGLSGDSDRAMVLRTRRAVRGSILQADVQRQNRKRNAGIAILVAAVVLIVLSPAIWSGIDDLSSGEYISDMTPMMTLLAVVLSSAVLAALLAGWKSEPQMRDGKRHE